MVRLLRGNHESWELYRRIHGQVTVTGEINILAAYETMDRMEIPKEYQLEILDLVMIINSKVREGLK